MKRFVILLLALVFVFSMSSTAFAEPAQIASGIVEEALDGAHVRVTLDLTDNWSAQFYPSAFYLYDKPVFVDEAEFAAYGTLLNDISYASLLESHAGDESSEKDGYTVFTTADNGEKCFVAAVAENLYILLLVDPSVDGEAVWARVNCELEDDFGFTPVQTASGVVADSMDESVLVSVKLDLAYGWSARFYPMAFYLCSPDCQSEEEFDAYGTLLDAQSYASILESHADDESFVEQDGRIVYKTDDGQTGFIAKVDENEYITLLVAPPWDAESVWARVSYKPF